MTLLVPGEGALIIVVRRPLPSGPRQDPLQVSRISSVVIIISSTTASTAITYHAPTPAFLFDEVCAWHIDGGKTSNVDCLQSSGDGPWSGNNTMDSRVVVEGSIDARKTAYHVQNPSQSRALQALSAPPLRPLHSVPYIGGRDIEGRGLVRKQYNGWPCCGRGQC
ncbi:hypothetical protein N7G274_004322 [Stereocaulon virgatum]|uniref:Uncharacterized protein n=1 Tax=Stereocaulon virgatum TaxID=373712 RepID=A0ABR4AF86_9LECA